MIIKPSIFKDYDIRAVAGEELDIEGVERLGQAIATYFKPQTVAVGHDMRITGKDWQQALITGITKMGVNVIDLGEIATDMAYFAAGTLTVDLAVMISASHNPPKYNGFKIVKRGAAGVSGETGIYDLRDLVTADTTFESAAQPGTVSQQDLTEGWIKHALSLVDVEAIKSFKVVVDAGNGMGGKIMPLVDKELPITVTPLFFELDGNFPNHLANPILTETHGPIIETIKNEGADLGIMFDGDGDRMFLLDETGRFISGTLTTAMVAVQMLEKEPGSTILYNAICGRVVPETVNKMGGKSVRVRVGHTIIKEKMREHNGLFAGEHSGHYFFRDNFSADSGLIAALVVLELMSKKGKKLSELVHQFDVYPSLEETNFNVADKEAMMKGLAEHFTAAKAVDWLDGVSIWFEDWWANIRPSNTQPVLRLNVEADNAELLKTKSEEIMQYIKSHGGTRAEE
ncbi:MAG: phosphomannomutase/phosphoglucomutase [Candidatus Pacebacteria bacterium CG10_big_fil_rev_8_21_14_0_10_44_11]|nr:MAG: phosphomannomutase/phosphoglucomutase [Candidatus Pacebacteria bacterium CG10_big_fil_rev_8_21_14_0_10_44_11]